MSEFGEVMGLFYFFVCFDFLFEGNVGFRFCIID